MHFYGDNARVEKQAAALKAGDFETFKKYIERTLFLYVQPNVTIPCKRPEQPVSLALSLSEKLLDGCGMHGESTAAASQEQFRPLYRSISDEYKA